MAELRNTYLVRLRAGDARRAIAGSSFLEAALAYLEVCHPPADAEGEVALVIREDATGQEQCFRVEIATGRTEACD